MGCIPWMRMGDGGGQSLASLLGMNVPGGGCFAPGQEWLQADAAVGV